MMRVTWDGTTMRWCLFFLVLFLCLFVGLGWIKTRYITFTFFISKKMELNEYVTISFSMNKDMHTYIHFLLIFWSISFATRCFGMFLIPFLRSLSSFLSHIFFPILFTFFTRAKHLTYLACFLGKSINYSSWFDLSEK